MSKKYTFNILIIITTLGMASICVSSFWRYARATIVGQNLKQDIKINNLEDQIDEEKEEEIDEENEEEIGYGEYPET